MGYRLAMTDTSGSTAWTYDARGRVITETKTVGEDTFVTGWTYDQRDQVVTQTYPGDNQGHPGEVVATSYDKWGQPYSLVGEDTYVNSTFLDSSGRPDMVKLGLVGTASVIKLDYIYYAWDAANGRGRLKQIKAGPPSDLDQLQNLTYSYDAAGNVTRIAQTKPITAETVDFAYDALNRLLTARNAYSETYTYDEIGNLKSKALPGSTASYTYPDSGADSVRPHAVTTAGDNSYGYDPNGNMVTRTLPSGTFYLRYDRENRLAAVDKQDGEALARIADFAYDGDGNRVRGVVTGTSTVTTTYIGAYFEWVSPGTAVKYYYLGGKRVAMRDANLHFLLGDHLGSTAITADANGVRTGELRYTAWGETRYEYQTTPTKRRYTGQMQEAELGLYFYNARWYDPYLNRWIQPDTIVPDPGDPQSMNRYTYARNCPLRYTDPTGHYTDEQIQQYLMDTYGDLWEAYWKAWSSDQFFMDMLHAAFSGSNVWTAYGNYGSFHGVAGSDTKFGFTDRNGQEGGLEQFRGAGPLFLNPDAPVSDRQTGSWAWRTLTSYTYQPVYIYSEGAPPVFAKAYVETCYDTTRVTGFDPTGGTGLPWLVTAAAPKGAQGLVWVASRVAPKLAKTAAGKFVAAIPSPLTTAVLVAGTANYIANGLQVERALCVHYDYVGRRIGPNDRARGY